MAILIGILFCLAQPFGNTALGEKNGGENGGENGAQQFSLEKRLGPNQAELIAHPPLGYKVNLKFPQSIRASAQKYLPKKKSTSELRFALPNPHEKDQISESKKIQLNLAYCSQNFCRLDVRTVLWKDIPFTEDLNNQRTPSK